VNLALSLLYAAERDPTAEAAVAEHRRLTYSELRERAARIAAGLEQRGVSAGDRVACVLRNELETVELYWASQWLGACFVPLSHRLAQSDLDYCLEDSAARVVVRDPAEIGELVSDREHSGALGLDDGAHSIQLYTSGTTGHPKGVPRSHRAERAAGLSQVV
jgi:2-furoate---CoA ligase